MRPRRHEGCAAAESAEVNPIECGKPLADHGTRRLFLTVPIDCLTLEQTVLAAHAAMQSGETVQHVCINVAKFVAMRTNPELDRDVRSSHIVSVDGMGIVWAARLLGISVPERVAGVELMESLIRLCASDGYRPFLLGAKPDVLQCAVSNIKQRFPELAFAGWRDGYFHADEESEVVTSINLSRAHCLFIGMPTPRKERFLRHYRDQLGVPFIMGVGGGLDILAGQVHRAPQLVQEIGLEWLFRTIQEPLRLAPRYFVTNAAFAAILAKALLSRIISYYS